MPYLQLSPLTASPPPVYPHSMRAAVGFGADKKASDVSAESNAKDKADASKPGSNSDSFLKITAKEAAKNGAVIGLTLMLAPLLGPALVGAVGGGGLISGMMFGVVVPAALEYGLNRYEGRMDHFKVWAQDKIYSPAKKILTPLAGSPLGRVFHKNPKQWLADTLEKLNPDALIEKIKSRQATKALDAKAANAASVAGGAAKNAAEAVTHHPLSPQRFMQLFRQHLAHLGWGPAMLVTLHGLLGGIRQYFSISHQFKSAKSAFGKGVGTGITHSAKSLLRRGGIRGLRLGLFLRQALIANTVVWGAMKGINVLSRLMYGKGITQLMRHSQSQVEKGIEKGLEKVVSNAATSKVSVTA